MSDRDELLVLLREAAEIEHQLMVQYLFAAYSLKTEPEEFPGHPDRQALAARGRGWSEVILGIAREEMGHLITVQQVILSLGGRPHFDRDSFPIAPIFYPFTFRLERLTRNALARYVWTEKPREEEVGATRDELFRGDRARIEAEVWPHPPNEVGRLYAEILRRLGALRNGDFDPDARGQTDVKSWPGIGSRAIVATVATRSQAIDAIEQVVRQGEGHLGQDDSHFERFLALYREFPPPGTEPDPSRPVATNPNTADPSAFGFDARRKAILAGGRITDPETLPWALLFNQRYNMLLAQLTHALMIPGAANDTARFTLIRWTRDEMALVLAPLAKTLTRFPLRGDDDPEQAGAPFELDGTGPTLSDDEAACWCAHQRLIDESRRLRESILPPGSTVGDRDRRDPRGLLSVLAAIDQDRGEFIATRLDAIQEERRHRVTLLGPG